MLTKLAKNDTEKYTKFWNTFGAVIKEGASEDFANKEKSLPYSGSTPLI